MLQLTANDAQTIALAERDPRIRRALLDRRDLGHRALLEACWRDVNVFAHYVFGAQPATWHYVLQALYSRHSLLCVDAPVEHGKTTQTFMRVCWEIGKNPAAMIGYFSNSTLLPERVVRAVRQTIEGNARYREVFPHVTLVRANSQELWVERQGGGIHPTLIGLGVGGSIIGSRFTHIILDDIQDFANTWSENERRKLWELLQSTVLNRRLQSGVLWDIGTPWHVQDARHKLRRLPGYTLARFDATRGLQYELDGMLHPIPRGDARGLWPDIVTDAQTGMKFGGWGPERLDEKRSQMTAVEFDRQFRCIPSSGSLRIFNPDDVTACLALGRGLPWPQIGEPGEVVITGVDLAIGKQDFHDEVVLATCAGRIAPSGQPAITPLRVAAGRGEVPWIARQFLQVLRCYPWHAEFVVENNQAQDYLVQALKDHRMLKAWGWSDLDIARLRVRPHTTTARNKWSDVVGIRAMAADFEQRRWILPCDERGLPYPEIQSLVDGLLAFDPGGHTSDYVMAFWMASENLRSRVGMSGDSMWTRFGLG